MRKTVYLLDILLKLLKNNENLAGKDARTLSQPLPDKNSNS